MALRRALGERAGRELPLFELHGEEAFRHLVRVASSLESAILGEPQILGQVKDAFQRAADLGFAGKELVSVLGRALRAPSASGPTPPSGAPASPGGTPPPRWRARCSARSRGAARW